MYITLTYIKEEYGSLDRRALAERMEQELLRDPGGRTPMRGGASHLRLARQWRGEVGQADGLAHAQVAGDHRGSAKRAREDPLRRPAADAAQRRQPRDHLVVRKPAQLLHRHSSLRDGLGRVDDVLRLARGELQRP